MVSARATSATASNVMRSRADAGPRRTRSARLGTDPVPAPRRTVSITSRPSLRRATPTRAPRRRCRRAGSAKSHTCSMMSAFGTTSPQAQQVLEHGELAAGDVDALVVEVAGASPRVQTRTRPSRRMAGRHGAAPQSAPQPRHEHDVGERLGEEVVGTGVQRLRLVELTVLRRQHQHRRPDRPLAQGRAELEAVDPRQHHVEHDHVVGCVVASHSPSLPVGGHVDGEALVPPSRRSAAAWRTSSSTTSTRTAAVSSSPRRRSSHQLKTSSACFRLATGALRHRARHASHRNHPAVRHRFAVAGAAPLHCAGARRCRHTRHRYRRSDRPPHQPLPGGVRRAGEHGEARPQRPRAGARGVDLGLQGVPDGWKATLRGGGFGSPA